MTERIQKYLAELADKLIIGERISIRIPFNWDEFPDKAGVYIIRENGKICYCGETGNLRGRMKDLLRAGGHTLRKTVGVAKFSDLEGFAQPKNKRFLPHLEEKLNRIFEEDFEITVLTVDIGRKELEEKIIEKHKPIYNIRAKRASNIPEKTYSFAEIRKEHKSAYMSWSEEEENRMIKLRREGKTIKEIAEILGRKTGAISTRMRKIRDRE